MLSDITVSVDDDNGDQEFLQEISDAGADVPITVTMASGSIYQGDGVVTDELSFSTANATASMSLSGSGKLRKQS